jgi:hypothetical protein
MIFNERKTEKILISKINMKLLLYKNINQNILFLNERKEERDKKILASFKI